MSNCELKRMRRQFEEEISDLKLKNEEFSNKKQQKKKELQAELEQLKKEKKEESKKANKQIQDLNNILNEKLKEIGEKRDQIRQLNGDVRNLKTEIDRLQAQALVDEHKLGTLTVELETAIDNFSRSHAEASLLREQAEAAGKRLREERAAWDITANDLHTQAAKQAKLYEDNLKALEQRNEQETKVHQVRLDAAKEAHKLMDQQLKNTIDSMEQHNVEMMEEHRRLKLELEEEQALTKNLRDQIRPIGSQLERRYEEARYRLSEALKRQTDLEEALAASNRIISELKLVGDNEAYLQRMHQLQTYNQELEQQFNSQMDIITALKRKFIVLKGGGESTTQCQSSADSIGWTSNSSEGTNSLDGEEEEHSEGEGHSVRVTQATSAAIGSYSPSAAPPPTQA